MSKIHIVVDSDAQISPEVLAAHDNLHCIAMKVRLGEQEWAEDDLTPAALFAEASKRKLHPQTSQPSPGDFVQVCQPLLDAGHEVIMIIVSGGLSGTVQGARAVARMMDDKRVHVIDSGTASIGMLQMAMAGLQLAEEGVAAADIVRRIEAMIEKTRTLILVDTLEYLHKGGRIGGAAALFGSILQIRPVIHLVDGKVAILDKVRTKQRAINRMLDEVQKHSNFEYIGVGAIEAPADRDMVIARLKEIFPETQIIPATIGSVLAAHLGPGMMGIVFQEKI